MILRPKRHMSQCLCAFALRWRDLQETSEQLFILQLSFAKRYMKVWHNPWYSMIIIFMCVNMVLQSTSVISLWYLSEIMVFLWYRGQKLIWVKKPRNSNFVISDYISCILYFIYSILDLFKCLLVKCQSFRLRMSMNRWDMTKGWQLSL